MAAAGVDLTTTICVRTGPPSTTCHLHPLHLTSLTTTPHPAITRLPETTTNRGPGQNITIIQQSMTGKLNLVLMFILFCLRTLLLSKDLHLFEWFLSFHLVLHDFFSDGVTTDQLTNFCGKRVIVTGEAGDEIKEYRISKLNLLSSHVPDR